MSDLFVSLEDLNAWGEIRGDTFNIEEAAVKVIERNGLRAVIYMEDGMTPSAKGGGKPQSRQRYQEQEILRVIKLLDCDPKSLPKDSPGKPGIKAKVRRQLQFSPSVFNKAWDRLSATREIIKLK